MYAVCSSLIPPLNGLNSCTALTRQCMGSARSETATKKAQAAVQHCSSEYNIARLCSSTKRTSIVINQHELGQFQQRNAQQTSHTITLTVCTSLRGLKR